LHVARQSLNEGSTDDLQLNRFHLLTLVTERPRELGWLLAQGPNQVLGDSWRKTPPRHLNGLHDGIEGLRRTQTLQVVAGAEPVSEARGESFEGSQVVVAQHEQEVQVLIVVEGRLDLGEQIGSIPPAVRVQDKQFLDLVEYDYSSGLVHVRKSTKGITQAGRGRRDGDSSRPPVLHQVSDEAVTVPILLRVVEGSASGAAYPADRQNLEPPVAGSGHQPGVHERGLACTRWRVQQDGPVGEQ
jgi:hypothetical protein